MEYFLYLLYPIRGDRFKVGVSTRPLIRWYDVCWVEEEKPVIYTLANGRKVQRGTRPVRYRSPWCRKHTVCFRSDQRDICQVEGSVKRVLQRTPSWRPKEPWLPGTGHQEWFSKEAYSVSRQLIRELAPEARPFYPKREQWRPMPRPSLAV